MKTDRFKAGEKNALIFALTLISAQVALYFFMWVHLLGDPSLKGMDFISFYTAGRIARDGNYHQLYSLDLQRIIQASIVGSNTFEGGANLSQHPPYLAPLLSILAVDDFIDSYILWSVVRLGMMIICVELIRRFLRDDGWKPISALMVAIGAVCFFPFFLGLLGGQDTAFIMTGLLIWLFGMLKKREVMAGYGLALSSLSPLIAIALGLPLLTTRRKAAIWFMIFMLLLSFYSLALVGVQGIKDFFGLMSLSSQGDGYGLNQAAMYNLLGLLLRNLPNLNVSYIRLISWTAFGVVIIFAILSWWNKRSNLKIGQIGILVVLIVFTMPHVHTHALSYLLLPLLSLIVYLYKNGKQSIAIILIPTVSTALTLITFLLSNWLYSAYYLLMLILLLGLLSISNHNAQGTLSETT